MRVTFSSQYRDAQRNINLASSQLLDAQEEVSSGKRVEKPSDDPSAAAAGLGERAELGTVEQYERAADSVSSRLTVVDTVLSDVLNQLTAAQTAATSARGTTATDSQREAAARELEGIRSSLVDDFNTSFRGTYVFAGTASTTAPYTMDDDGTVSAYAGNGTEMEVDIDRQRAVTVTYDGDAIARGDDTDDVFTVINNVITAVRAGDDDALGDGITALQSAFDRVTATQSRVGASMNAVDGEKERLQSLRLAASSRLSKLEDANMTEAVSSMNRADTAYQAALGAVSSVTRVSLLDYLG